MIQLHQVRVQAPQLVETMPNKIYHQKRRTSFSMWGMMMETGQWLICRTLRRKVSNLTIAWSTLSMQLKPVVGTVSDFSQLSNL